MEAVMPNEVCVLNGLQQAGEDPCIRFSPQEES